MPLIAVVAAAVVAVVVRSRRNVEVWHVAANQGEGP